MIKSDPNNARLHSEENKELINKSLSELGAGRSIVIDSEDFIVAGNGVFEQAKELGIKTKVIESDGSELIVIKRTDLKYDDNKRRKLAIADNATGETSEWNFEELTEDEIHEWNIENVPDEVLEAEEDDFDITPPEKPITVLGDLYEIGEHRLLCGDSTNEGVVAQLMNGHKADMVFTDPPYGMFLDTDYSQIKGSKKSIGFKGNKLGNKYDKIIGDNEDFTPELIKTIFTSFPKTKEIFIWGGDYFVDLLPNYGKDGSWLVWNKRSKKKRTPFNEAL